MTSWAEAHDNRQSDARPPFGVWSVARTLARVSFTLLPAVDVADGQAVRLVQGVAGTETRYGDPLEAALAWQRDGAEWIHLVDLDAAFGRGSNRELLAEVVGTLDVEVELSGGIRDDESLDRGAGHRLPPGQPRHRRAGAPGVVRAGDRASTATGSRSASTSAAARSPPAAGPGRRRPLRGAGPARRRRLRPLRRHRRQQGRHAAGPEPRAAARRRAPPPTAPVVASGGVAELADLRRAGRGWPRRAASRARSSARRSTRAGSPCPRRWPPSPPCDRRGRPRADERRRPGHPVPGRRRRAGGQGRQLPEPARRRRPGRAGRASTTPRAPTS